MNFDLDTVKFSAPDEDGNITVISAIMFTEVLRDESGRVYHSAYDMQGRHWHVAPCDILCDAKAEKIAKIRLLNIAMQAMNELGV